MRVRRKLAHAIERWRAGRMRQTPASVAAALRSASSVLVVCHGNIIRSPFAARLLAQAIGERQSLSIVSAGVFTPFITQGQGFMAIVIAMLARGKPVWVVFGSFLFGISLSIATALQLAGVNISTDVINILPFIAIILALVTFARRSYLPPALCVPYIRGAR